MKKFIILIFLICVALDAQDKSKIFGVITFKSSQFEYIKFSTTEGINIDDTLYDLKGSIAAIVKFKSSTSIAAKPLNNLQIGDTIFAFINLPVQLENIEKIDTTSNFGIDSVGILTTDNKLKSTKNYNLRMSIQSYGDLTNYNSTNRLRYSLNSSVENIFTNNLNFNSYFIVTTNRGSNTLNSRDVKNFLKIYELSFDYTFSENHNLIFGRSINPNIISLGSIDGIQYSYKFNQNRAGLFLGSRPDYFSYWFNINLFQGGLFFSRVDSFGTRTIDNSIAFIEQTNHLKSDRRFIYFQHRNDLLPNTYFFFSTEFDFFLVNKGMISKKFNLTSINALLTIRPIRQINFNISYDSRKNIYYLESFKNSIDTLFENVLRHGLRLSAFIRPFNLFFINLYFGTRETSRDLKASNNYGSTIGFNYLPIIYSSISFGFNRIQTPFVTGTNYSSYFSKNIFNDLMVNLNFRLYEFRQNITQRLFIDRFLELGLYANIFRNLSLSLTIEQKLNNEKSKFLMFDITNRF
ncbi:MAG: hypothetical protein NUV92_05025 [Ignavibacteria bacterium]|jgi:hypothetical protein|nr:hypothetical protein [Ignavibacteria bacterium]MDH7526865.1 hypothetical protein [Ignavibacteria bacterium]